MPSLTQVDSVIVDLDGVLWRGPEMLPGVGPFFQHLRSSGTKVLLDDTYCSSTEGQSDTVRCKDGHPRKEPPGYCYGYTDFLEFVRDCEVPFFPFGKYDPGRLKMETYLDLLTNCKTSTCPDGKLYFQLSGKTAEQIAQIGNPYLPQTTTQP